MLAAGGQGGAGAGRGWTLTHPFRGPSTVRVDAQGRLLSLDADGGGVLRLSWDTSEFTVPFRVLP